jgi:lysine biosynthesis protein LysW
MDDTAQCPVCGERITFGGPIKLHEALNCPTCLTDLEIVGRDPLELDYLFSAQKPAAHHDNQRHSKKGGKRSTDLYYDDDFEEIDDYLLEKRLRRKPNRHKRRQDKAWEE